MALQLHIDNVNTNVLSVFILEILSNDDVFQCHPN